jgi:hypothetical protein
MRRWFAIQAQRRLVSGEQRMRDQKKEKGEFKFTFLWSSFRGRTASNIELPKLAFATTHHQAKQCQAADSGR